MKKHFFRKIRSADYLFVLRIIDCIKVDVAYGKIILINQSTVQKYLGGVLWHRAWRRDARKRRYKSERNANIWGSDIMCVKLPSLPLMLFELELKTLSAQRFFIAEN